MKYKIKANYFVKAPSWIEAEKQVEQGLVEADTIESEPISKSPTDIVTFGIASRIYEEHTKIFFSANTQEEYEEEVDNLKSKINIWLTNIVEDIINSNEQEWE
jgi:hypothetical protein